MAKLYTDLAAATTNEVDNLDPILVVKLCGVPVAATHNRAIEFDGNPCFGKVQLRD